MEFSHLWQRRGRRHWARTGMGFAWNVRNATRPWPPVSIRNTKGNPTAPLLAMELFSGLEVYPNSFTPICCCYYYGIVILRLAGYGRGGTESHVYKKWNAHRTHHIPLPAFQNILSDPLFLEWLLFSLPNDIQTEWHTIPIISFCFWHHILVFKSVMYKV